VSQIKLVGDELLTTQAGNQFHKSVFFQWTNIFVSHLIMR